jgi:autotransporter-like protein
MRKSALLGSAALIAALSASSGAWAQCSDNFGVNGGGLVSVSNNGIGAAGQFSPLGSSMNAFISTMNTMNTAFLTTTSAFVSAPGNPRPNQLGGGVWGRDVFGSNEASSTSTATLDLTNVRPTSPGAIGGPGTVVTGAQNCRSSIEQKYGGYQVGADWSILNHGGTGANWHGGITAGAMQLRTRDVTPSAPSTFSLLNIPGTSPAGDLFNTSEVTFVGIYSAYTRGGFFADGLLRFDFYQNSLSEFMSGLSDKGVDARSVSLTYNTGYHMPLHSGWFVEPSAGFVWSNLSINSLSVPGSPAGSGFIVQRGTVSFSDIESELGRASFTVGRTFTHAGVTWQPYFTASVFHEFNGDASATSLIAGSGNPNLDNATLTARSSGGVGTYGQYALGTAAVLGNSGWLSYVRADYRNGDRIEGWGVSAGLRYQFNPVRSEPLK